METKICNKCLGEKDEKEYHKIQGKRLYNICKSCKSKKDKERWNRDKDKKKESNNKRTKRHYQNNQRYYKDKATKWKKDNEYNKRKIQRLDDTYIKDIIIAGTSLKAKDVPRELIELKRKQIKLRRNVKENYNN